MTDPLADVLRDAVDTAVPFDVWWATWPETLARAAREHIAVEIEEYDAEHIAEDERSAGMEIAASVARGDRARADRMTIDNGVTNDSDGRGCLLALFILAGIVGVIIITLRTWWWR
jgi:hypothetical protein